MSNESYEVKPSHAMKFIEADQSKPAYHPDALKYMYQLGENSRNFAVFEVGGHTYVNTNDLVRIEKVLPKTPPVQSIFSLQGFVDYITSDPDDLFDRYARLIVHVRDERTVVLRAMAYGPEKEMRIDLARCVATNKPFQFNAEYGQEDFIVKLQSLFIPNEKANAVGKVVGNLVAQESVGVVDDGISQSVTVKGGIARMGKVVIQNPVPLRPIRTFMDIEQPESPFILRIRNEQGMKEPKIALYEADGDMWRVTAVHTLVRYLTEKLKELVEKGVLEVIG